MKLLIEGHQINVSSSKCEYNIIHPEYGVSLKGAGLAFQGSRSGMIGPDGLTPESESESGGGARIKYSSEFGGLCELSFEPLEGGVAIRMDVQSSEELDRIAPLVIEGDGSGVELGGELHRWRVYRFGYQSWSPSGSLGILEAEPYPPMGVIARAGMSPAPAMKPSRGKHRLDWATVLYNPETSKCVLVGFLTARRYASVVEAEVVGGTIDRIGLRAYCEAEGTIPRDGERFRSSERLWVALGDDPHALWEKYLDLVGREMEARIPKKSPFGWCSWYHYFTKVAESDVMENLNRLAAIKDEFGVDLIQLDDGYCKPGDWLDWNRKFPSGPEKLAGSITQKGFTAGLWLAPFICTRASRLYRERPDLLLRDERGKPVLAGLNPMWKGVAYYALDTTNPAALDWVGKLMTAVREWGFRYVKIDFVFAAALRGKRHDPTATGLEAYRRGVEAVRRALGDDVFLLGCGAPILPSVGLVDAMRISADVAPQWRNQALRIITRAPFEPSCENAIHGTMCRAATHRRLWLNDPDCLLVRKKQSKLSLDEIRTLATAMFMSGGMIILSDNMAELDADRWDIVRAATPLLGERATPIDLFDNGNPAVFYLAVPNSDRKLVALINWSDKPAELSVALDKLGVSGASHAFEYWSEKYLGIVNSKLGAFNLPPHGCVYISLVPADAQPRLLSTTVHLGQGAVGVSEKVVGDHLEVAFNLAGQRKGRAYVIGVGENAPQSADLNFRDNITLTFF